MDDNGLSKYFAVSLLASFGGSLCMFSPLWAHNLVLGKYLRSQSAKNKFPSFFMIDLMVLFGVLSLVNGLIASAKSYDKEQGNSYFVFLFLVANVLIILLWSASLSFLEKEEIQSVKKRMLFHVILFPLINISVSGAIINSLLLISFIIKTFSPRATFFSEPMLAIVCTDALMFFAIWLTRMLYIKYIYREPIAATASRRG